MDRLFGKLKMNWLAVVLFAIVAGIYTGIVMLVPAFNHTSLQDIGVSYEVWVLLAIIVVVNCEKPVEAMLKCFVFFLISQPLVYAVEVACGHLSFDLAMNYYTKIWLPMTFLTLPGGFVAFFAKKENTFGQVVLGIGNAIVSLMGVNYALEVVSDFPHHLLTTVFCAVEVVVTTLCIQKSLHGRIIAFATTVILTVSVVVFALVNGLQL